MRELFHDLFDLVDRAHASSQLDSIQNVCTYMGWVTSQAHDDGMQSAADICFFIPLIHNEELLVAVRPFFDDELLRQKQQLS